MHTSKGCPRGRGLVRMALILLGMAAVLCTPALADETQEAEVKASIESFLRSYTQEAMLYEETDQRAGTVYEPQFVPAWEQEKLPVNSEWVLLTDLQKNIQFVEKKAAFYAAMRQMQDIYREDLQLHYTYSSLKLTESSARASVKETATFYYTDSSRRSVYETNYTIDVVKLMGRWLVADVTDGSRFDTLYKKTPDFDLSAVLEEFSNGLEAENAVVSYPYAPEEGASNRILYNGKNAAAYASTYCRQDEGTVRNYYNSRFKGYAGIGGDCMNFTSQCLWAGFGGNETAAAINGHGLPMDTQGANTWYGRSTASGTKDADIRSWISCSGFWAYLNGSNAAQDTGMYTTVISVPGNSPVTGAAPEELVGAAAHVEGAKGSYSHAIIFTAATGNRRSEIWFCSHTKDVSHLKLGDYYFGPMRVYIPRYIRVNTAQKPVIHPERIAPVLANTYDTVGFQTDTAQARLSVVVQAPDGTRTHAGLSENGTACLTNYLFTQPGLYRVDCTAASAAGAAQALSYYVRCVEDGLRSEAPAAGTPQPEPETEVPPEVPPETGTEAPTEPETETPETEAEAENTVPFPDMPPVELDASLLEPVA